MIQLIMFHMFMVGWVTKEEAHIVVEKLKPQAVPFSFSETYDMIKDTIKELTGKDVPI